MYYAYLFVIVIKSISIQRKPFSQQMKREILQKLQQKDLENYQRTLTKRVEQLKSFNIELAKDNSDITTKLNNLKEQQQRLKQAHKKLQERQKKKVNKSNFDFDDLYKIGISKVGKIVNKDGVMSLLSVGEEKIRKGFGYAGSMVKKYMGKGKDQKAKEDEQAEGNAKVKVVNSNVNEEENINQNADFNSYDIGDGRHFQNYQPMAEQNLEVPQVELQSKEEKQETETESRGQKENIEKEKIRAPRKKIFDREQEQQILAQRRLIKQKQSSQQSPSESFEEPDPKTKQVLSQSPPSKELQPLQPQTQPQPIKKQIKQMQVQPNKVIDLEPSQEQQQEKQKEIHSPQMPTDKNIHQIVESGPKNIQEVPQGQQVKETGQKGIETVENQGNGQKLEAKREDRVGEKVEPAAQDSEELSKIDKI